MGSTPGKSTYIFTNLLKVTPVFTPKSLTIYTLHFEQVDFNFHIRHWNVSFIKVLSQKQIDSDQTTHKEVPNTNPKKQV